MREVTCVVCGNPFQTDTSRAAICSAECRKARRRARDAGSDEAGLPPPTTVCEVCGKEFAVERGVAKACSEECRKVRQQERWRQQYHGKSDEEKKRTQEMAKQRRRADPEAARERDKRRYARRRADSAGAERVREKSREFYARNSERIQEKRRQKLRDRLSTMTEDELAAWEERQREYQRRHFQRLKNDPEWYGRRLESDRERRAQRREQRAEESLALLAVELQQRADGEVRQKLCEVCGKPVVGRISCAQVCSNRCARVRHRTRYNFKPKKVACAACGKEFIRTTSTTTCSEECHRHLKRKRKREQRERQKRDGSDSPNSQRPDGDEYGQAAGGVGEAAQGDGRQPGPSGVDRPHT